ncbi:MAG: hypothetical protein MSB11_06455, partial [Prevotella sp.]|nr:hypothetical protein [Prevotella sp.]
MAQWWIDEGHYGGLMREAIGWCCASSEAGTKYALIWCWRDKKVIKDRKNAQKVCLPYKKRHNVWVFDVFLLSLHGITTLLILNYCTNN